MDRLKQRARWRFGDEIIRNGDAICPIKGSAEVPLNVWNDVMQKQACGVRPFSHSDAMCY
jgi:hypothetical protein